jgi:hypothetical protein
MRYREPFTLYPRKMKSGLVVWYYQTYDENGRRTTARSTGQITKMAAKAYCLKLYKEDRLIPAKCNLEFFRDYAKDWWVWGKCEYLKLFEKIIDVNRHFYYFILGKELNHFFFFSIS